MISEAYIAGQIHQAVYKKDGEYCILKYVDENVFLCSPIRHFDLNAFTLTRSEIEHFKDIEWTDEQLRDILNKHIAKYDALDFFLKAMDVSFSLALRKEAMTILAEEYFADMDIKTFIRNRVLGSALPNGFDPITAAQTAKELQCEGIKQLYNELSYAKDIIIAIRHAWKQAIVDDEASLKGINIAQLDKVFTDDGLFAGFVTAVLNHDGNAFDDVIITQSENLKKFGVGQPALFLTHIKANFKKQYSFDDKSIDQPEFSDEYAENLKIDFVTEFNELINTFSGKTKKRKSIKDGEKEKLPELANFFDENRISRQIEWIKKQIINGDTTNAERGVIKLIEFQDVNSDPEHLCKSLCSIAQCCQENNLIEMADLLARRTKDLNPKDPVPYCILAENLRSVGKLSEALDLYSETIDLFPNDAIAQCGKAETLRKLGRLSEALDLYHKTIDLFPNDVVARSGKAETLRDLGKLSEALDLYNQTIGLFPKNAAVRSGKAETLRDLGKLNEALELYNQTIDLFPKNEVARNGKAETLRDLGKLEEALELYHQTIELFPNDVVARNGKAETLRDLGKLKEALDLYNETISLFPNNAFAQCGKAETLRELGKSKDALELYNQTIRQFNNDQVAKRGRFATLLQIGGDLIKLENETKIINPATHGDWVQYHIHCMTLIKLNRMDEAIKQLRYGAKNAVLKLDKLYFKNALSYALIKNKKYKDAIVELNQADTIQPITKILATHALAAENRKQESQKYLPEIIKSPDKKVKDVSQYISDRYHLSNYTYHQNKKPIELDIQIDALEFALLTRFSSVRMAA